MTLPSIYQRHKRPGFTLIELLVVITIITIMVATATVSWNAAQMRGRDGRRKSDLKAIQQGLELYFKTNGKYPAANTGKIQCVGAASGIGWGSPFVCDSITYMQQLPKDPVWSGPNWSYYYSTISDFNYILSAKVENDQDPEYCTSICIDSKKLPCEPQTFRTYCVVNP